MSKRKKNRHKNIIKEQTSSPQKDVATFQRENLYVYGAIYVLWTLLLVIVTDWYSAGPWFAQWNRWDSEWYQQIFENGYDPVRLLVYPPVYPFVVGLLSKISFLSFHAAAVVVNTLSYFAGLVILSEALSAKFDLRQYRIWLFLFALSTPASYFVLSSYSDSLFFFLLWLLIAITILEWWKIKPWIKYLYGALFILLPAVRITGYALLSWTVVKRWAAALVLVTLAGWLYLHYYYTGDPFFFLKGQELFGMAPGGFFSGLYHSWSNLTNMPVPLFSDDWNNWLAISLLPIIMLIIMVATGIWLAYKQQWLLALTLFSLVIMSFNQGMWRSVVRYIMPLYGLLGLMLLDISEPPQGRLRWIFFTVLGLSFLIQFYFAIIFHSGGWAF